MKRTILVAGLAALAAMAFGAVLASGSQAAETTAFTCVKTGPFVGPHKFSDAHCKTIDDPGGEYGHVVIPNGLDTELTVTTFPGEEEQVFQIEIGGAELTVVADGNHCRGCSAENATSGGQMKFIGPAAGTPAGRFLDTGVVVAGLESKCKVVDPTEGEGKFTTEPLRFETTGPAGLKISPATGNVFGVLHIEHKPAQTCTVEGEYEITGFVEATIEGATLTLNDTEHLTVFEVFPLSLKGKETVSAGEPTSQNGNALHNPIAFT
jgi:hypothetical protein